LQIGALAAGPWGGYSNERFGRRLTMLSLTIPCLAGWLITIFAENVEMIYVGRFLVGKKIDT
jgi:MFS family permease